MTSQLAGTADRSTLGEVAWLFLKLGTVAFGGPAAHIAMMEDEVVRRRLWLTREQFLDYLGATNLIPGPTPPSSPSTSAMLARVGLGCWSPACASFSPQRSSWARSAGGTCTRVVSRKRRACSTASRWAEWDSVSEYRRSLQSGHQHLDQPAPMPTPRAALGVAAVRGSLRHGRLQRGRHCTRHR